MNLLKTNFARKTQLVIAILMGMALQGSVSPVSAAPSAGVDVSNQCVINASTASPKQGEVVKFSAESPTQDMVWNYDDGTGNQLVSDHAFTALGTHLVEAWGRTGDYRNVRCFFEVTVYPAVPVQPTDTSEIPEEEVDTEVGSLPTSEDQSVEITGDGNTIVFINGDDATDIQVGASAAQEPVVAAEPEPQINFLQRIWLAIRTFFAGVAESFDILFGLKNE
jgi:hypothetical protein